MVWLLSYLVLLVDFRVRNGLVQSKCGSPQLNFDLVNQYFLV